MTEQLDVGPALPELNVLNDLAQPPPLPGAVPPNGVPAQGPQAANAWTDDLERNAAESPSSPTTAQDRAQADLKARTELVKYLRKRPHILGGLGLQEDCTAREMMNRLSDLYDLGDALRKAGGTPQEVIYVTKEAPKALRAEPWGVQTKGRRWRGCCACVAVCLSGALGGLFAYLTTSYVKGWQRGTCNLKRFAVNRSAGIKPCTTKECLIDVDVRVNGEAKSFAKRSWKLPLEQLPSGRAALKGDCFRCCDHKKTLNCCELYDWKYMSFCDNWPHKTDGDGNPCSEGNWQCLFKVAVFDEEFGEEVSELIVYEPPALMPFLMAIGFLILAAIVVVLKPFVCACGKRCVERCSQCCLNFEMRKLKSNVAAPSTGDTSPLAKDVQPSLLPPPPVLQAQVRQTKLADRLVHKPGKDQPGAKSAPRRSTQLPAEDGVPRPPDADAPMLDGDGLLSPDGEWAGSLSKLASSNAQANSAKNNGPVSNLEERQERMVDCMARIEREGQRVRRIDDDEEPINPFATGDLSKFARLGPHELFNPIIDPLPPSPSGRSARSHSTRGGGRRRLPPTDLDALTSGRLSNASGSASPGATPSGETEGQHALRTRSRGQSRNARGHSAGGHSAGHSSGHSARSARSGGSSEAENKLGHGSLRVTAKANGGHSSRSGGNRLEAEAGELYPAAEPRRGKAQAHDRGAAFAAAAVRGAMPAKA